MAGMRAWSWANIDGKNVLAFPSGTQINLLDTADFSLIECISPSGHDKPIVLTRWSMFHAKLASVSASHLIVHAPQFQASDQSKQSSNSQHKKFVPDQIHFLPYCVLRLDCSQIASCAFSRGTEFLVLGSTCASQGISLYDTSEKWPALIGDEHKPDHQSAQEQQSRRVLQQKCLWQELNVNAKVVKFSPCKFLIGSLASQSLTLTLWRLEPKPEDAATSTASASTTTTASATNGNSSTPLSPTTTCFPAPQETSMLQLVYTEQLEHPEHVVYFSWKPPYRAGHVEEDESSLRLSKWNEPARMVLTCTEARIVRVWVEEPDNNSRSASKSPRRPAARPHFVQALRFEPSSPVDNLRWVLCRKGILSEDTDNEQPKHDWLSGVDKKGILRLWQIDGLAQNKATIEETKFSLQLNTEDKEAVALTESCVLAYFRSNYSGNPTKMDILLQRNDGIVLSFRTVLDSDLRNPHIKERSWYRSHLGSIIALTAHPSLPLIASVDRQSERLGGNQEIMLFWLSLSSFSTKSRLIPSGVVRCAQENGEILCVQWIATPHFDATPLFLVAYTSGIIEVHGRVVNTSGVYTSPRSKTSVTLSPSSDFSPWIYFDYTVGESGADYEILRGAHDQNGVGFELGNDPSGKKTVVSKVKPSREKAKEPIQVGDELLSINNTAVEGKSCSDIMKRITSESSVGEALLLRFRSKSVQHKVPPPPSQPSSNNIDASCTLPAPVDASISSTDLSSEITTTSRSSFGASAGSVSLFGGWRSFLQLDTNSPLSLLCIAPVYADDGEFLPSEMVIFAVDNLPGKLLAWRGRVSYSTRSFAMTRLHVQDFTIQNKDNITSIAGERDYRQRAFSAEGTIPETPRSTTSSRLIAVSLNTLLFIGDADGTLEHWRCRVVGDEMAFTMMSSWSVTESVSATGSKTHPDLKQKNLVPSSMNLNRRGFSSRVPLPLAIDGVSHIEVDDPNRIAVLFVDRPQELCIFEAESGLGILREEDLIRSNGNGNILGFSWCSAHVEFNVDAIAVHYEKGLVLYEYSMHHHTWRPFGDRIQTELSLFDCTRDSSALLIGAGDRMLSNGSPCNRSEPMSSNETPQVIAKWDEPGTLLQMAMDWKRTESPQKHPVWHPYVIITTLFGLHARVGLKDTVIASDKPSYEFRNALADAVQMLKLLSQVLTHDESARKSARSGVLVFHVVAKTDDEFDELSLHKVGRRDSIGRYSTVVGRTSSDKAENLFNFYGASVSETKEKEKASLLKQKEQEDEAQKKALAARLEKKENSIIADAIDVMLKGTSCDHEENAKILFAGFSEEHLMELKAILDCITSIHSLGMDVDASGADICAQRCSTMFLFQKSLRKAISGTREDRKPSLTETDRGTDHSSASSDDDSSRMSLSDAELDVSLAEPPSSAFMWALLSDSQQFLTSRWIRPQATWDELRPLWLGLWVKDVPELRAIIERLAKSTFARNKDAMSVCLYYIALGKRNILAALAKVSKEPQNKNLSMFLDHDFTQERWSIAAVKNAYSLLSKKQYEQAAAFFLLCEPPRTQEALRVLVARQRDPSLALVISRLVENRRSETFKPDFIRHGTGEMCSLDNGTKVLLDQDIIPHFRKKGERWLESCALWWLEQFDQMSIVLLPSSQPVDMRKRKNTDMVMKHARQDDLMVRAKNASDFFIDLTSLPLYFQFLYSNKTCSIISWALRKMNHREHKNSKSPHQYKNLASPSDIEHCFSFSAYVCKRSGLSDTALVEMLQARQLVKYHAQHELAALGNDLSVDDDDDDDADQDNEDEEDDEVKELKPIGSKKGAPVLSLTKTLSEPEPPTSPLARTFRLVRMMSSTLHFGYPLTGSPRHTGLQSLDLASGHLQPVESSPRGRSRTRSLTSHELIGVSETTPVAPWLRAQIADIECRRWSSSAFVGKMIGLRVAREMICHFREALVVCFRQFDDNVKKQGHPQCFEHDNFLDELCMPLCQQFGVNRNYVYEGVLAVLQPHAQLHMVEYCFLLSKLNRVTTLSKWIYFVALTMLHSTATLASCPFAEDAFRDWESLTIQLCYLMRLEAQREISLPNRVIRIVSIAVRVGCLFMSWYRNKPEIMREAMAKPLFAVGWGDVNPEESDGSSSFANTNMSQSVYEDNAQLIRMLQKAESEQHDGDASVQNTFGFIYLGTIATHLEKENDQKLGDCFAWARGSYAEHELDKLRRLYSAFLMVTVLRTLYARAQALLGRTQDSDILDDDGKLMSTPEERKDISSSLFIPQKLWQSWSRNPLSGIKQFFHLTEAHLSNELDYAVKPLRCLCGRYGFESSLALDRTESNTDIGKDRMTRYLDKLGIPKNLHVVFQRTSDDYVIALMKDPRVGVKMTLRGFRTDARVYLNCFLIQNAIEWGLSNQIFQAADQVMAFLRRCCKARKMRMLVQHHGQETKKLLQTHALMFVDPWEIEARESVSHYMLRHRVPMHVELGWDRLSPICDETSDEIVQSFFAWNKDLMEIWKSTNGEPWLVNCITRYRLENQVFEKDSKTAFLMTIYSRMQRNALFHEVGLPYRFMGNIKIRLLEAKNLISCNLCSSGSHPYVMMELWNGKRPITHESDSWHLHTYRSRVGDGPGHARWGSDHDQFVFRFSVPTHHPHFLMENGSQHDQARQVGGSLCKFFQNAYDGPPVGLVCTIFHKNIVFHHQFMGRVKIPFDELTTSNSIDRWFPVEKAASGSLHLRIELSFQLMGSSSIPVTSSSLD